MVGTLNYLDFEQMFVWDIAGGEIAIFLAFMGVIIMALAARARMPNQVTFMILGVFALFIGAVYDTILSIVLLVIGSVLAFLLSKMMYKEN